MSTPALKEFATLLIKHVRDAAIKSCDRQLKPETTSPIAARWASAAKAGEDNHLAHTVIPDCVDETVFYLLQAIDQGNLPLTFRASNGEQIDLHTEGLSELSGWYMGAGGWRAIYSKERFVDDFSDLAQ